MIKLIDILKENTDRDIQVLNMLLYKWINYAGSQDTLPKIEELSKKLKLNTLPSSNVVYRVIPMIDEDIKDYPPKEIIKIDKDKRIVSATVDKSMINYFSEGADWAYVITYKPYVILNFDELEKKYEWTGDVGEGEILIDAKKSQVIDIKRIL
jgi:hypothetical protein